jgi:NADH-quinone oxidoreductase subunit C
MMYEKPDREVLLAAWQEAFPELDLTMEKLPLAETVVTLPPEDVIPAIRMLVEQYGVTHLSTITGDDTGEGIALLYHFWAGDGITLRTSLSYDALHMPTLTQLIPGAAFYEREIWEMLGIVFDGLPDPQPLLMPDDWEGEHPLRRSEDVD